MPKNSFSIPLGYETPVGERNTRLSGGQRLIEAALDRLLPRRTTLIIAHRLPTIRRANKILLIDAGRVLEMGTHDDLLARDGNYAVLHAAQSA